MQNYGNDEEHIVGMMRKSVSMGNLGLMGLKSMQKHSNSVHTHMEDAALRLCLESGLGNSAANGEIRQGYASDGLMQSSSMSSRERRKGVPWTEEEHRLFLAGLQKLGKGDWRGISRNFVTSRTPTQVASHAQKYFLRQSNLNKRKRRSSLFDIISSNSVPARNLTEEHPHRVVAAELDQPIWELGIRHSTAPSSSCISSALSPFAKPIISKVSANLCLGRSSSVKGQDSHDFADKVLSLHSRRRGKQALSVVDAYLLSTKAHVGLDDATRTEYDKPVMSISSSSSSRSLSSSPSSPSLCRIDEASELSSLSLRIAPPTATDQSPELALKLEPPMASRQSAIFPSTTKVCERKDVLLTAGA